MQQDSTEQIRQAAMELDNALERRDKEAVVRCFCNDCEIELLGVKLKGSNGVRKWLDWLYEHLAELRFSPIHIAVDGETLFEEFVLHATLEDGRTVDSKQAEVLTYEDGKIKSLRIYFDRLDFADAVATGFVARNLVKSFLKRSVEGLSSR